MSNSPIDTVPLPRPFVPGDESNPRDFYTAEQLLAYGDACAASEREAFAEVLERVTTALAHRIGTNADEWVDVRAAREFLDALGYRK